jgi:hypothetical protein
MATAPDFEGTPKEWDEWNEDKKRLGYDFLRKRNEMLFRREKHDDPIPKLEDVANELNISVDRAKLLKQYADNIEIANRALVSDRKASMGNTPSSHPDPKNPFHFGGRKSRRHAKKSRRHAKKSRRHAKKSRRHGKSRR